jgi:hypothetical protein
LAQYILEENAIGELVSSSSSRFDTPAAISELPDEILERIFAIVPAMEGHGKTLLSLPQVEQLLFHGEIAHLM